jgi:hypothetical protein
MPHVSRGATHEGDESNRAGPNQHTIHKSPAHTHTHIHASNKNHKHSSIEQHCNMMRGRGGTARGARHSGLGAGERHESNGAGPTDRRDGCYNLAKLELVENGCLSCSVKTDHQDPHLLLTEEALEAIEEARESGLARVHRVPIRSTQKGPTS